MTKNFKYVVEEARALGLAVDIIYPEKEVVKISNDTQTIIVKEIFSIPENQASSSAVLAKNKEITYRFWEREHIPFPRSRYYRKHSSFPKDEAGLNLRFPVVFKKSNGKKSHGIHTNIVSFQDLARIVADSDGSFIVQEMVFGKEYRLLVYRDRLLAALELVPPRIVGNGKDSITDLIDQKNIIMGNKIITNEKVIGTLAKNGFSPDSIPTEGQIVSLQENSCLAEGGSSVDCTDVVHEDVLKLALRSARAVNMRLAGIDIICEDISIDPDKQKISFLETNSFPSLSIHYDPTIGKPRRVIKDLLEDIFHI